MSSGGDSPDAPSGAEPIRAARDDDGPGGSDGSDGNDDAGASGEPGAAGEPTARRRRRRRRRRGGEPGAPERGDTASDSPGETRAGEQRSPQPRAPTAPPAPAGSPGSLEPRRGRDARHDSRGGRGAEPAARNRDERGGRGRGERRRSGDARSGSPARGGEPGGEREAPERRSRDDQDDKRAREAPERYALNSSTFDTPTMRLDPRRPVAPTDDLDLEGTNTPAIPWGKDDDGPPAEVTLAADLPPEVPDDDPDPLTHSLLELPSAALGDDIANVAGVRFVPGGRVQWYDAGDADYAAGERVIVEGDRGTRLAWLAVAPARRPVRDRGMRRVIRRASEQDLRGERDGDTDRAQALRIAKDKAAALRLPLKVFRVEVFGQFGRGARLNVYYTTDERLDLRDFLREVSAATGGGRVELRQLGVRDEAKAVGGIGSCGLTLCCTTWLPDFVPVSIKMAKDQGLVLSPTKVSGQCGRLKCCLVYEQAAYAELRKGLPKLGKRVIAARGEGRVVEVDVLRQRIRVSYAPGDTEVVPASTVRPLFPSGNQPVMREPELPEPPEPDDADEPDDSEDIDLPDGLDGMAEPGLDAVGDPGLEAAISDELGDGLSDDDPS